MKTRFIALLVIVPLLLACQFLAPGSKRYGTVINDCAGLVQALNELQPSKTPDDLYNTGIKTGDEFDANDYFKVLTHLSMEDGYTLDYVYFTDFLGSFPKLYALPAGQPPYASAKDIPAGTELGDFQDHLQIEDVEQGYYEYVLADIMAPQFYLEWHANYNDTQVVCSAQAAKDIVDATNSGDFGTKFDLKQQAQVKAMTNIEPAVRLTKYFAIVEVTTFTNWGGFFKRTYFISRSFPHKMEMYEGMLVEYDCGIMF